MTTLTCTQARALLMPWLDSELDATTTVSVGEHLAGCATCAERFEREGRVEHALADELRKDTMPDDVWRRLQGALRDEPRADAGAPALRRGAWNTWRWLAAAAVLLVALVLALRDPPLQVRGGVLAEAADAWRAVQLGGGARLAPAEEVLTLLAQQGFEGVELPRAGGDGGHELRLLGARREVLEGVRAVQVAYTCCDVPTSIFLIHEIDLAGLAEEDRPPARRARLTEAEVDGLQARTITVGDVWVGVLGEEHLALADAFAP